MKSSLAAMLGTITTYSLDFVSRGNVSIAEFSLWLSWVTEKQQTKLRFLFILKVA